MTKYFTLQDLIPQCTPLDRIKRKSWTASEFILMPQGEFDSFYYHSYMSTSPHVAIYPFTPADLIAGDWTKL